MKRVASWTLPLFLIGAVACVGPSVADDGDGGSDSAASGAGGGGGEGGGLLSPLDAAWEAVATSAGPSPRWGHVVAPLDDTSAIIVGGTGSGLEEVVYQDAWRIDSSSEPPTFTRIEASDGPGPRYCGCAVYDPDRDTVVVIGGRDLAGPLAAETWELDLVQSTWTQLDVETPPGVVGCAAARSSDNGNIYLFGGGGVSGFDDGTYRFESGAWVALDTDGPSARYDAVLREHSDGSLLLFSGSNGASFHADVWRFDVSSESWSVVPMAGQEPVGRRQPWIAPADGGFYYAFGMQGSQPLGDIWLADLDRGNWTLMTADAMPGPRAFTPYVPGGEGSAGLVLGGFSGYGPVDDAWRLRLPQH